MTKKLLIFVVILTSVTAIFAENEKVSCESDYGTCSLERSDKDLETHCFCHNGNEHYFSDPVIEGFNDVPLTEEWCMAEIDDSCKKIDAQCSNNAGACDVNRNGDYKCSCYYVDGNKTGSGYFGEKGCNEILVETCGTEAPTLRKTCQEDILNQCFSYIERFTDFCLDPLDDIDAILDAPVDSLHSTTTDILKSCCYVKSLRDQYKNGFDCLETYTYETCENKECCACIAISLGDNSSETGDTNTGDSDDTADSEEIDVVNTDSGDTANNETQTDGTTQEDTADSNKKEESKSDGCSMLFI